MNLLVDPLPESVMLHGERWPVCWDYRFWILFELLVSDEDVPETEKLPHALTLCYGTVPEALPEAVEKMLWFYRCGRDAPTSGAGGEAKRVYSFEHDDAYIYAAFLDQYRIDLLETTLHWWKFCALFRALKADNEFVKIMGYRAMKIDPKMDEKQKTYYRALKQRYALPCSRSERSMLDAINAALLGDGNLDAVLFGGEPD